jgi:hypothetical protein
MTPLAAFTVCAVIALIIHIGIGLFFPPLIMLMFVFPVLLSEAITGEGGTFSPNGSGKKSALFQGLTTFFSIVQVLLLAGVLYGIYRLFAGPVVPEVDNAVTQTQLSSLEVQRLQLINGVLWFTATFFALMVLVNLYRFWDKVKEMPRSVMFLGYVLPLLSYPFAYFFLTASKNYLTNYPAGSHPLGRFALVAGVVYLVYLLSYLIRDIGIYRLLIQRQAIGLNFRYWFFSALALVYKILFIYFLIRTFQLL